MSFYFTHSPTPLPDVSCTEEFSSNPLSVTICIYGKTTFDFQASQGFKTERRIACRQHKSYGTARYVSINACLFGGSNYSIWDPILCTLRSLFLSWLTLTIMGTLGKTLWSLNFNLTFHFLHIAISQEILPARWWMACYRYSNFSTRRTILPSWPWHHCIE